jgi:hypothetical protein
MSDASPILATLSEATAGLLFQSESDFPLEPFVWERSDAEITPEAVKDQAGLPHDAPVKSPSLGSFFKPMTRHEDWHNDEEKATVDRFRELVQILKAHLSDLKVYKIGEVKFDVFVIGKTEEGAIAGVKTTVVET